MAALIRFAALLRRATVLVQVLVSGVVAVVILRITVESWQRICPHKRRRSWRRNRDCRAGHFATVSRMKSPIAFEFVS